MLHEHPRDDLAPLAKFAKRLCHLAVLSENRGNLAVADCQVALPIRVAGVGLGEAVGNRKAVLERFERLGEIALRQERVADFAVVDGEAALPGRISGVRLGEAFSNGEAVAIGFQRVRQISQGAQGIADPAMGD